MFCFGAVIVDVLAHLTICRLLYAQSIVYLNVCVGNTVQNSAPFDLFHQKWTVRQIPRAHTHNAFPSDSFSPSFSDIVLVTIRDEKIHINSSISLVLLCVLRMEMRVVIPCLPAIRTLCVRTLVSLVLTSTLASPFLQSLPIRWLLCLLLVRLFFVCLWTVCRAFLRSSISSQSQPFTDTFSLCVRINAKHQTNANRV